jgi:hypothetical protein
VTSPKRLLRGPVLADVIAGLALVAVAGGIFAGGADLPPAPDAALDAGLLPRATALLIVCCGIAITLTALWRGARVTGTQPATAVTGDIPGEASDVSEPGRGGTVAVAIAALFLYGWAAFGIGYLVTTWAMLTLSFVALSGNVRVPTWVRAALVATVMTAAVWVVFLWLLNVRLPTTVLL